MATKVSWEEHSPQWAVRVTAHCLLRRHPQGPRDTAELGCTGAVLHYSVFACCVLSRFSHSRLLVTAWIVGHQAPLSMGFFRQEYWSGLPCSPPGDLPNPGIEPASLMSPALAGGFLPLAPPGKPC